MATDEYEAASQAAAANRFGAQLYVGFEARTDERSLVSYFAVPTFESIGGRSLATQIVRGLVHADAGHARRSRHASARPP